MTAAIGSLLLSAGDFTGPSSGSVHPFEAPYCLCWAEHCCVLAQRVLTEVVAAGFEHA